MQRQFPYLQMRELSPGVELLSQGVLCDSDGEMCHLGLLAQGCFPCAPRTLLLDVVFLIHSYLPALLTEKDTFLVKIVMEMSVEVLMLQCLR